MTDLVAPPRERLLDALEVLAPVVVELGLIGEQPLQGFKGLGLVLAQLEKERPGALARARQRIDMSSEAVARRRREQREMGLGG